MKICQLVELEGIRYRGTQMYGIDLISVIYVHNQIGQWKWNGFISVDQMSLIAIAQLFIWCQLLGITGDYNNWITTQLYFV